MKNFSLVMLLSFFLWSGISRADEAINATTEDGRSVLLLPDGTWVYKAETPGPAAPPAATPVPVPAPASTPAAAPSAPPDVSGGHLEGGNGSYSVRFDENNWHIIDNLNDSMEYALQSKSGDVIAMLIYENLQVPLSTLKQAILKNASSAAPDLKLINEKRITKNGKQIMVLKYRGTIDGKSFTYYGYYTSGDWGTLQFTVYSPTGVYNQREADMFALLDGLKIQK